MARERLRAGVRKALEAQAARPRNEAQAIADGVLAVAVDLAGAVTPGSLYWAAPFRYVIEQMAPRVCRAYDLPAERVQDVGEYLLASFNEFVVSVVEGFDREHFEAWTAALKGRVDEGA